MIFCLHYAFIMFGYCSNGLLLGRYMLLYGGATELDLGFVFMIHPMAMFARPLICAHADRYQNHKRTLFVSLIVNSLAYTPFIAIPYMIKYSILTEYFTPRLYYWLLLLSHAIGSIAFCGVRSLGDALAVNYAKKVGSSFGDYRKYGALGYGVAGFLLGNINQNWYLPDYVPAVVTNVVCLFMNSQIINNASGKYFKMECESSCAKYDDLDRAISESGSSRASVSNHVDHLKTHQEQQHEVDKQSTNKSQPTESATSKKPILGYIITADDLDMRIECSITKEKVHEKPEAPSARPLKTISTKQQLQIFLILLEYDIRIPLFFLLLFLGGLLGYAPPNFVFTYMDKVCNETVGCDSAFLSGLTMLIYCCMETLCYIGIRKFGGNIGHAARIQITLISLACHFFFYAFAISHLSPYFFIVELLHGLEYSISLTTSVELGYKFANEVGPLIPELLRRGVIGSQDDREMVRLSLTATMNSCFTLIYEGAGTMAGALIYGLILDLYSFETVWFVIGTISTCGFFLVSIVIIAGRCLKIEPKILRLRDTSNRRTIIL